MATVRSMVGAPHCKFTETSGEAAYDGRAPQPTRKPQAQWPPIKRLTFMQVLEKWQQRPCTRLAALDKVQITGRVHMNHSMSRSSVIRWHVTNKCHVQIHLSSECSCRHFNCWPQSRLIIEGTAFMQDAPTNLRETLNQRRQLPLV